MIDHRQAVMAAAAMGAALFASQLVRGELIVAFLALRAEMLLN